MTTEALVVLGLVALLTLFSALLWMAERRRDTARNAASRALRLEEQLVWDRKLDRLRETP